MMHDHVLGAPQCSPRTHNEGLQDDSIAAGRGPVFVVMAKEQDMSTSSGHTSAIRVSKVLGAKVQNPAGQKGRQSRCRQRNRTTRLSAIGSESRSPQMQTLAATEHCAAYGQSASALCGAWE